MKKGFTLIELLVVIAIIGILSSVVLASLNTAKSKARDAVRKSDLSQIQTALELYYNTYGGYPSSACPNINYEIPASLALEPKMKQFLSVPSDPVAPGTCYNTQYLYISDQYNNCGAGNNALATTYVLYATLEDQSTSNLSNTGIDAWLKGGSRGLWCGRSKL
jgi:prepilin-type N-terminal cleavage/methylation domain-containing protein